MFGNLGEDEKGWGLTTLGKCCELNPRRSKGIDDELLVSFVPMPAVFEDGRIDPTETKKYAEVKKGFTYFAENDVLFAKITPCMENGKGCIAEGLVNGLGAGSTEFHVLRPIAGKSNPYWLYILTMQEAFRSSARKAMTGTGGQLRVPSGFLENYPITMPPIDLQETFEEMVRQSDKSKFIGFKSQFIEMFGTISAPIYPVKKLSDYAHIKHGYAFKGDDFSYDDNGILLVTPGNFSIGGGFQYKKCKYFTGEYTQEYVLHTGDLIVTMTDLSKASDTLGNAAIVPNDGYVYLHNQRIELFDLLDDGIDKTYLEFYMRTDDYRNHILSGAAGSTVKHTSPAKILEAKFIFPPIEKQKEFSEIKEQSDKSKLKKEQKKND